MSRTMRNLLAGLSASLALLTILASAQPVRAELSCDELRSCKGAASCTQGGDPIGCELSCTGGGTVTCDPRET